MAVSSGGHPHPGHGPLEAPPLGFAGVALIGHPQGLGEPLGPARPAAVGEDEEGNPCRRQGLLPGSDLVIWLGHPVGGQGIVQVGQQELHSPGPEAGQVDGIDIGDNSRQEPGEISQRHLLNVPLAGIGWEQTSRGGTLCSLIIHEPKPMDKGVPFLWTHSSPRQVSPHPAPGLGHGPTLRPAPGPYGLAAGQPGPADPRPSPAPGPGAGLMLVGASPDLSPLRRPPAGGQERFWLSAAAGALRGVVLDLEQAPPPPTSPKLIRLVEAGLAQRQGVLFLPEAYANFSRRAQPLPYLCHLWGLPPPAVGRSHSAVRGPSAGPLPCAGPERTSISPPAKGMGHPISQETLDRLRRQLEPLRVFLPRPVRPVFHLHEAGRAAPTSSSSTTGRPWPRNGPLAPGTGDHPVLPPLPGGGGMAPPAAGGVETRQAGAGICRPPPYFWKLISIPFLTESGLR